ncbi:hypothetical protein SDJN02_12459, partial [Cucurbita argyrosperma subsp. argyrosperma]
MGLMRISFSFMLGALFGAYAAQNYNIPNVKKLADSGYSMATHVEKNYRKPVAGKTDGEGEGDHQK